MAHRLFYAAFLEAGARVEVVGPEEIGVESERRLELRSRLLPGRRHRRGGAPLPGCGAGPARGFSITVADVDVIEGPRSPRGGGGGSAGGATRGGAAPRAQSRRRSRPLPRRRRAGA